MIALIATILIVVLGSALCSGSEAALFSVSTVKVRQLVDAKKPAARVLLQIRENMSRPIATIVILNNIFNIVGSMAVGAITAVVLGSGWIGAFSALLTLLVIIFAEIIPKTLGERYAESIALAVARPVAWLTRMLLPLVWLVEQMVSPITKGKVQQTTNEAEIKLLAQIGQKEGSIEQDESLLIERAFRLNDEKAESLMTPRVSLTYLWGKMTLGEARAQIINSQHTRILVIGDSIDDVIGVALKDELLIAIIEGQTDRSLAALAHEVRFIPGSVKANRLLTIFRATRRHLAVVVDEFGGVAGVVTLEDVLEVLTGEIVDETDLVEDMQEWSRQRRRALLAQLAGQPEQE
jgi:CBS domain containing-hemolysin-like protein